MKVKFFFKDAVFLALLYNYYATGETVLLYDKVISFAKVVNENLAEINFNKKIECYEFEEPVYFIFYKDDKKYVTLKSSFNIDEIKVPFIHSMSIDLFFASQKANALETIDVMIDDTYFVKIPKGKVLTKQM